VPTDSNTLGTPNSFSPDGRTLLFTDRTATNRLMQVSIGPAGDGGRPRPFPQTSFIQRDGNFSPDGKWVAYVSNESGRDEVYAMPFPPTGAKQQISTAGGDVPRWRADGKELFYLTPTADLMAAEITRPGGTLQTGKQQRLFTLLSNRTVYAPSPDGQRFLVSQTGSTTAAPPLTVVHNWRALLKK
jgi:Tol biopolymer transport system component